MTTKPPFHVKAGKVFKIGSLFYLYRTNGLFWFRFFDGYGMQGKDITKHEPLFSERYGYTKFIQIKNWRFKILKP